MPLQIYYPFKPYIITQAWGVYNADYTPLGFSHHNGVDANIGARNWNGTVVSEFPVYCPVGGFKVAEVAFYPNGGGNQLGLVSKQKYQIGDKLCYVSILLCHAKKILVKVGDEPAVGELVMIADNTGFSTGVHTHMGMYRLDDNLQKLDANDETGSYNPMLLFAKQYAVDVATYTTLFNSSLLYYKYVLGIA